MIQITFRNQLDDIKAWADYMAREEAGRKLGRSQYSAWHANNLALASLGALPLWVFVQDRRFSLILYVGFFMLAELLVLLRTRFRPVYALAKEAYSSTSKGLTLAELAKWQLPRTLKADVDELEFSNPMGLRRCNWSCVEKIGVTSDFVFIHISGCSVYYVPRRDFPSEEAFREFAQALTKLWKDHEPRNSIEGVS